MKTNALLQVFVDYCLHLVKIGYQAIMHLFSSSQLNCRMIVCLKPYYINRKATSNTMRPTARVDSWACTSWSSKILPFLILAFSFSSSILAQDIVPTKPSDLGPEFQDSLQLNAVNLPFPLQPLNGLEAEAPYYRFLWIFGDGNFGFVKDSTFVNHRYQVIPSESPKSHDVFLYKNALYGGGKPPPKRASEQVQVIHQAAFDTIPYEGSKAVKEDAVLHLQKHIDPLLPNDTTLWILSIRNPDTISRQGITGQVYLFYDGIIAEERMFDIESKDGQAIPIPAKVLDPDTGPANYAEFQYDTTLIYNPEIQSTTFQTDAFPVSTLKDQYQKVMFWNFGNLLPGEEKHIFIQFTNDSLLLDKFNPKRIGSTKMMAMISIYSQEQTQDEIFNFNLSEEDAKLRGELQLDSFFLTANAAGQGQTWFSAALQEGGIDGNFFAANNLVDIIEVNSRLSSSYDPNYMRLEACSCPPATDGAQKVITTIHFENDGQAPTKNIFVSVEVPEEIQLNSVFDSLLRLHPPLDPESSGEIQHEIDESTRTITWKLIDFQIESVSQFGAGDPATYGEITFTMLTANGVDISDIPEMQACIRFDEEDNEAVCTLPVKVSQLTEADVSRSDSAQMLQCENCDCPPFDFWAWLLSLPWWLAALVLIGVLILIWLFRRLN